MKKLILIGIVMILLSNIAYSDLYKHTWNITKNGCEFVREEQMVDNITSFINYDECYQTYLKNEVKEEYEKKMLEERTSNISIEKPLMSLFNGEGNKLKKEGGFALILMFLIIAFIVYNIFKKK